MASTPAVTKQVLSWAAAGAAAGGVRGWGLGAAAALYVASVLALVYLLCRRIIAHKERYGLKYQRVRVGRAACIDCRCSVAAMDVWMYGGFLALQSSRLEAASHRQHLLHIPRPHPPTPTPTPLQDPDEGLGEGQGDGKRALFSFLHRRMHGAWGDPVIEAAALEPRRSQHYLASGGLAGWPAC